MGCGSEWGSGFSTKVNLLGKGSAFRETSGQGPGKTVNHSGDKWAGLWFGHQAKPWLGEGLLSLLPS